MSKITHSEDRELLRDLYAGGDWMDIYYFHQKYLLSPAQISRAIRKLKSLKLVESMDYKIKLTDFGCRWLLSNRRQVFLKPKDMEWKTPSSKVIADYGKISEYIPRPSKMRQTFFERLYDEGQKKSEVK